MGQSNHGRMAGRTDVSIPTNVVGSKTSHWNGLGGTDRGLATLANGDVRLGVVDAELPAAERVRALARHTQSDGVAYQSVAVAGLQILERVLRHEKAAAAAAISLAQRDKLDAMVQSLEQTVVALRTSLSAQGTKMLFACTRNRPKPDTDERSWWFALTEAIEALESGIDAISGIVSSQPRGGAARLLSGTIARLLHRHHNDLLSEAEHWIG
ncbi:MAG TPA: hypothetical protein VF190_08580 [Rhodothermales bacterium]